MARFVVRRGNEAEYLDPGALAPGAVGLSRWRGVGEDDGAAHTDFGISRIEPGGRTDTHVHSFEESFHVLEGEVVLVTPEATVHLVAGDYGVMPIGVPHAWRALEGSSAAWADLFTPPARERYGSDTFRVAELTAAAAGAGGHPRSSHAVVRQHHRRAHEPRPSVARAAGGLGEHAHRTAGVQRDHAEDDGRLRSGRDARDSVHGPVRAGRTGRRPRPPARRGVPHHDGEVLATFDGQEFLLREGDIAWAGVGCVHSFAATGDEVRWLETQAPQMPPRHAYRFVRDWEYLTEKLEEEL